MTETALFSLILLYVGMKSLKDCCFADKVQKDLISLESTSETLRNETPRSQPINNPQQATLRVKLPSSSVQRKTRLFAGWSVSFVYRVNAWRTSSVRIAMVTLSERSGQHKTEFAYAFRATYFLLQAIQLPLHVRPPRWKRFGKMGDLFFLAMAKSKAHEEDGSSENGQLDTGECDKPELLFSSIEDGDEKHLPFLSKQKSKLLQLRDNLLDSMTGVSRDTLRSRAEGSEASAFGMHQADAGSDAYDRDFALSLLSQEQDALYEIEEALKRIDAGTYGVCEISGKPIPDARLEAIPFARFTVECQTKIEKRQKAVRVRKPVKSLFGLTDEEGGEGEERHDHRFERLAVMPTEIIQRF